MSKIIQLEKESKKYTYCPDCHNDDKDGYRGKRCKWCCALLIKDPLNRIFVTHAKSRPEVKDE